MKHQTKITNPYSLRMRVLNNVGEPGKWFCNGVGQMIAIEDVQRQIRALKSAYPNKSVEIEFVYEGELRDYNGKPSGTSIVLERKG